MKQDNTALLQIANVIHVMHLVKVVRTHTFKLTLGIQKVVIVEDMYSSFIANEQPD